MLGRMWMVSVLTAVVGLSATTTVQAQERAKELPAEVVAFVERSEECGTLFLQSMSDDMEMFDDEYKDLECGRLDFEESKLRRKYWNNDEILQAIDEATELGC